MNGRVYGPKVEISSGVTGWIARVSARFDAVDQFEELDRCSRVEDEVLIQMRSR